MVGRMDLDRERLGVVIETARLRIRSLRDDDLADLVSLTGNRGVARWVSSVPHPYGDADGRKWIARPSGRTMPPVDLDASASH